MTRLLRDARCEHDDVVAREDGRGVFVFTLSVCRSWCRGGVHAVVRPVSIGSAVGGQSPFGAVVVSVPFGLGKLVAQDGEVVEEFGFTCCDAVAACGFFAELVAQGGVSWSTAFDVWSRNSRASTSSSTGGISRVGHVADGVEHRDPSRCPVPPLTVSYSHWSRPVGVVCLACDGVVVGVRS